MKQLRKKIGKNGETRLQTYGDFMRRRRPPQLRDPSHNISIYFDFLEVCRGSGVLSDDMSRRGYVVGPIIDITYSKQYDLISDRVFGLLLSWSSTRGSEP